MIQLINCYELNANMKAIFLKENHMKLASAVILCLTSLFTLQTAQASEPAPTPERISPALSTLLKKYKPDPKAEAEVIERNTQITIGNDYMSHSVSYVAVYINSEEAVRDYSQISISFNSFYEDIQLEFANVRTPEGQMDSIKPDATQIQSPTDENFYHDRKELLFSLPNVRKGSVIEFQYRYTDTKKIVPNQWFDSFSMNWWEGRAAGQGSRADAILNTELTITAPKQFTLINNDMSSVGITKTKQEKGDLQILTWRGKNIPKEEFQESMPRDERRSTQLRAGTMTEWNLVAAWANALATPHIVTDANLDKLIAEIAKKAITPEEKVKAVYQAVQEKVRYVFAHVGRGGYEPHNAFEVLTNGYGDCKDQTILAVTMLRKLGVAADPSLVITRNRGIPDMTVPTVSFDHMIVHIPKQTGLNEIWMDTSGDKGLFPGFSVGLEGQPALVVNNATQKIVTIPTQNPESHFAHIDINFNKFEGKDTDADFTVKFGGEFEQRLRGMWQYSRERDKTFREFMSHLYNAAEVTQLNGNNAESLWESFNITGKYRFKGVWNGNKEPLTYGFNITQFLRLFVDFRDLHKPADRTQEFEVDPGYKLSAHIVLNQPSPEHIATINNQGQNIDNAYFTLEQKGHFEGNNYIIDVSLIAKPIRITKDEYAQFYQQVHQLLDANDWSVTYKYDKNTAELAALTKATEKGGKSADFVALSKWHIKNGQYDKALEAARQATKADAKNGEAYYFLGLALGYTNQLYDSEKAFIKAEELGFAI